MMWSSANVPYMILEKKIFTARRHASAIYAAVVCLFVYLSQVGVLLKRLNVGSRKQRYTIAQGLELDDQLFNLIGFAEGVPVGV